jgi:hypothetical protein
MPDIIAQRMTIRPSRFFHRRIVAIVMQQPVAPDAEGADQQVDGSAHCKAALA